MVADPVSPLAAGRDAFGLGMWQEAYAHLAAADRTDVGGLTARDPESLGEAAFWTGRAERIVSLTPLFGQRLLMRAS